MKKLLYLSLLFILFNTWKVQAQPGSNMYDAFDAGTLYPGSSFSQEQYNDWDVMGPYWYPGDPFWYKITLTQPLEISVSNCGSAVNTTWIEIYDVDWTLYASNQGNGTLCSGGKASVQLYLAPGTYYIATGASYYEIGYHSVQITANTPVGTYYNTAISAGSFGNWMGGYFTDTRNNHSSFGFNNEGFEPSNDIWYELFVASPSTIRISNAGSEINTALTLLAYGGETEASFGPLTPGSLSTISLSPGIHYLVAEGYGYATGKITTTIDVIPSGVPRPPGANILSAIDAGTLSSGSSFVHTFNQSDSYEVLDQYYSRIYYKFNLNSNAAIKISNCTSPLLTGSSLYLLNHSGTEILRAQKTGPLCQSSKMSSIETTLQAGAYYLVTEGSIWNLDFAYEIGATTSLPLTTTITVTGEVSIVADVDQFPLTGSWNLIKDIERNYKNDVIQRDTTSNYVIGDMKMAFDQESVKIYKDNLLLETGTYNLYDKQFLMDIRNKIAGFKIKQYDPNNGILVLVKEVVYTNLNDIMFREITESHFTKASN
jgi:hypothetical protein